ncbi:hypothetical protein [Marinomonas sp. TW1]|uniref:hypothetical protein n=1 Tax=Marinomonas sp. TW1 TaxID=1561203 RepID=UPI0007AF855C|nr:hypothetical protein [Marinomonas sp. TW1]KZN12608.1 hypothetical protein OA79_15145 [Marinomonas sp. TW1]
MATKAQLAAALDVNVKTIRNHEKEGYAIVYDDSGKIDIEKSVHAYVNYLSESLRQLRANNGRKTGGTSRNSKQPKTLDDWKKEKEKQAAIKLHLQNGRESGELVPYDALLELVNGPLSMFRRKLLDVPNQLQKRLKLSPKEVKSIEQVIEGAFDSLNELGNDELPSLIENILEKYSKHYVPAEEETANPVEQGKL